MSLRADRPGTVYASEISGHAFEAAHAERMPLMQLERGQELDLVIHFEENCGRRHARFCPCAAVSMTKLQGGRSDGIRMIHPESDAREMVVGMQAIEEETDAALLQLSNRSKPRTYC